MTKCSEVPLKKKRAGERFVSIGDSISKTGEMPPGENTPEGERVLFVRVNTRYHWCYIGTDWIWYIIDNNRDGDDWGRSNVLGKEIQGIGWKAPYNEKLAQEIRDIANILNA